MPKSSYGGTFFGGAAGTAVLLGTFAIGTDMKYSLYLSAYFSLELEGGKRAFLRRGPADPNVKNTKTHHR
jgi:hypothetical protein